MTPRGELGARLYDGTVSNFWEKIFLAVYAASATDRGSDQRSAYEKEPVRGGPKRSSACSYAALRSRRDPRPPASSPSRTKLHSPSVGTGVT